MSSINACEFLTTIDFTEYVEELFDLIDDKIQDEIEAILDRDLKGGNLNYDIYDLV
jgi:frataxin-like iron-binding protein CyaY